MNIDCDKLIIIVLVPLVYDNKYAMSVLIPYLLFIIYDFVITRYEMYCYDKEQMTKNTPIARTLLLTKCIIIDLTDNPSYWSSVLSHYMPSARKYFKYLERDFATPPIIFNSKLYVKHNHDDSYYLQLSINVLNNNVHTRELISIDSKTFDFDGMVNFVAVLISDGIDI